VIASGDPRSNQTRRTDRSAAGPGRGTTAHGGRQRGGWTDQCSGTDPGAVQPARDSRVRHSYPYRSAPQARSHAVDLCRRQQGAKAHHLVGHRRIGQDRRVSANDPVGRPYYGEPGIGRRVRSWRRRMSVWRDELRPTHRRIRRSHATAALSAVRAHRGTEGSNPFPSSGESDELPPSALRHRRSRSSLRGGRACASGHDPFQPLLSNFRRVHLR
jgi:hypothetical protein